MATHFTRQRPQRVFSHAMAAPALPCPKVLPRVQTPAGLARPPARIRGRTTERMAGRGGIYRGGMKRALDVALVLLAAPFLLLVVGLLAIWVRRDGGPAFYSQTRIGRGGRHFRMWKLRSMVCDADARLEQHLEADPAARAEWARYQKLRQDPRVTPIGRLIRKTSLDELPQLWNVLTGDMSLVGPRPMMADQDRLYPGTAYYRLRPGITGPWQVSSRNDSGFAERARFDQSYETDLGLGTDLRLLAATLRVVLRGTGC